MVTHTLRDSRSFQNKETVWGVIIFGIITVGVGLSVFRGGATLLANAQGSGNSNANAPVVSPIDKIKQIFTPANAQTTVQPVRVIDEQSQVIDVVKKSSPAVVSIIASAQVPKMEQCNTKTQVDPSIPPEMRQYFNFDVPSLCQHGTQLQRVGAGSGFIVSSNGYIITNKHVVQDEKAEYTVVLNDPANSGVKIPARVMARDPQNDVAVLRIDRENLPFLPLGDSDKLQVGQTVIAIGNALGQFNNTVSKGVVSGLARSITANDQGTTADLRNLIQTDAAINPGNSGGPLLDIGGNVIGMNTALAEGQSLGFAIPINVGKRAFEQVRTTGVITPADLPFLGVRYIPITNEIQQQAQLPYNYGMLVVNGQGSSEPAVMPGSPADKVGIKANDIILEVNGHQLNELNGLGDYLSKFKPGDSITLKLYHQKQIITPTIVLGKKPAL